MGHIQLLSARYSLFGFSLRVDGVAGNAASGGGSMMLRKRDGLIGLFALLAVFVASDAWAQPRGSQSRSGPALPPSGHQTEAVDLNEGQSPSELFSAGCSVCHQSAAGLAKGQRERELTNFLRQHYTSSVQHAGALANFLVARGGTGAAPARPATVERPAVVERPPVSVGRRSPDEDRKPQEAARPPEREPAAKRKPPAATAARTPPPAAPVAAAPAEPAAEAAAEASPAVSSPPVEEKPAAPDIPL